MLSLPDDVLNNALRLLVGGITGFDHGSLDKDTPLAHLTQQAQVFHFILQSFNPHIQNRILSIHRQINQLLPIYKLPDELLQQIFLDACVVPDDDPRYHAPTILVSVSSRWRSVAISYTRLWNSLHSDLDVEITKMMLQRSQSAPLDVFCSCQSKTKAKIFFDLLTPHSMRWRALEFHYNNVARLSFDFLAGRIFPLLERVVLPQEHRGVLHSDLNHSNFKIVAPSLKVLEAQYHPLCLRLDHSIPQMLTILSFTASIRSVPFSPAYYYTLLSSTPRLQHLTIEGSRNSRFPDPDVTEPMWIDLPHLATLLLKNLRYKTIGFLLSSIVTLPSRYPDVDVRGELYGSLSTMFSLSPVKDSLLAGFSRSDQAVLMSLGSGVGVSLYVGAADDKKTLLSLVPTKSVSPKEDLSIIITVLLSGIRQLEIEGLRILGYGLGDKLHLLPRLERIKFDSDEEDCDYADHQYSLEHIITLIASSSADQSSQALCPSLRHLAFDTFHFDLDCLVELALARTPEKDGEFKNEGRLELVELGECFDSIQASTLKLLHQIAIERNFEFRIGELLVW
ncbi:hypothetical protein FRC03_002220 [Tulasnella sp. 419]|nr:hypothetical protein FRC03_002220 [Tulasnella sp. 419]